MALIYSDIVRALFRLNGAATATVPVLGKGVADVATRSGAGNYTVTLEQGLAADQCSFVGTSIGAAPADTIQVASVVHTSDTLKDVLYYNVTAAAGPVLVRTLSDAPQFSWAVFAFPGQ